MKAPDFDALDFAGADDLQGPPTRATYCAAVRLASRVEFEAYLDARLHGLSPREALDASEDALRGMVEWAERAMSYGWR